MAKATTVNAANLATLGAERLAEILFEFAENDAATKRRLRLELVSLHDPGALAKDVRKRLNTIARSRAFVDWDKQRAFAADLDNQREAIAGKVAAHDAAQALELMWQFMGLAPNVFERVDDSYGNFGDVFRQACQDLGPLASAAKAVPERLAEQVLAAIEQNDYGVLDEIVPVMSPALGDAGLNQLKALIEQALRDKPAKGSKGKSEVTGIHLFTGERLDLAQAHAAYRERALGRALQAIADAQGDVDGFIKQHKPEARRKPMIAAEIAERLVAAGRASEALTALDKAEHDGNGFGLEDWEDAKLAALEALDRHGEAQALRLASFRRSLSVERLRDYLSRLPDFDDIEAEKAHLDEVAGHKSPMRALDFLTRWPDAKRADVLVRSRPKEWDGNAYHLLTSAAKLLEARHPLAATILLRAMIDYALGQSRSARYKHAARHLRQCESLAVEITDLQGVAGHDAYLAGLKSRHGRKASFWQAVGS